MWTLNCHLIKGLVIIIGHSHGKLWTDKLIIEEIERVKNALKIDRFPTHSEIFNYTGNSSLNSAISKRGGTKFWMEKLGCKEKQCESQFGNYFEEYSVDLIKEKTGFDAYKNQVRYPYDITVNKHIKVDIKASSIVTNNQGYQYHSFNFGKKEPTCDIFLIFCTDYDGDINKIYVIPSCIVYGQTQVGISAYGNSKWDKFKDAWGYFDKYNSFYNEIMKGAV